MRLLLWFIVFFSFSFPALAQNTIQHDPLVDPLGHYPTFANSVEILSLSDSTTGTGSYIPSQRIIDLDKSGQLQGSSPYICGSGKQVINTNQWYDCITGDFDGDGFDEILSAWIAPNGSLRMEMSSASRLDSTYNWQWTQRLFPGDTSWKCDGPIRLLSVNLDSTARREIVLCIPYQQSLIINNYYFDANDKTLHAGDTTMVKSAGAPYDIASGFTMGGIDGLILVYRGNSGQNMGIAKYDYNMTKRSFALHNSQSVATTDAQWSTMKSLKITTGDFRNHGFDEAVISYSVAAGDSGRQAFCYVAVLGGLALPPTLPGIIPAGETWGHGYESDAVAADLNPANKDGDELIVAGPGEVAVLRFDASGIPTYCGPGTAKTPFLYKGVLETYPRRHFLAVENMDSDTSSATWGKEIIVAEHKPDSTTAFRILTPTINASNVITGISQRTLLNSTFKSHRSEIAVGDFDGDAIKIWKPTLITKKSVIQPIVELNVPPTHFDCLNDSVYDVCKLYGGGQGEFKVTYTEIQSQSTHFSSELEQGWGVSAELGGGFSLFGASVKAYVKASYDKGYYGSHSQDTTVTATQVTSSTGDDWILGTVTDYDFWEYPLTALGKKFGYILVQIPHFKGTEWFPDRNVNARSWIANHEVGNIFSYLRKDDMSTWIGSHMLTDFTGKYISTASSGSWTLDLSSLTIDQSKLTSKIGVEVGASIDAWGIEASVSGNYSRNEITTHTSTATKSVQIEIKVTDTDQLHGDADYLVTPFIYWGQNGAMVIDYAIDPSTTGNPNLGTFWDKHYLAYSDPGFILPWRLDSLKGIGGTGDFKLFSKSIHISPLIPAVGDNAHISAIVHNFSLTSTPGPVAVRFYIGNPMSGGTPIVGTKGETVISTSGVISPQNYATVQMDWKVPAGLNSTSNLYAVIDPGNTITEIHKDNNIGFIPFTILGTTGVVNEPKNIVPASYKLEQNYPNPFNPSTTIKYQIPKSGLVTLKVYDILGRVVATLVNENKIAGSYNFTFNASGYSSGVYIYQLRVNDFVSSRKMILIK